jgi:hypothetical protein
MRFRKSPLVLVLGMLLLATLLWTGCGGSASTSANDDLDSLAAAQDGAAMPASEDANIPNPVQMALSILNAKAPYNSELLNSVKSADAYTTSFQQAINLGIYQADLGYLIANHQTQDALKYFEAVKMLGDRLGIFGSMEGNMMERAEKNLDSRDSLFAILSDAFKHADNYLNENAMLESADLIVAGGWLESTYLVTQILKTYDSGPLRKRVGDDKLILPELLASIAQHKDSKDHIALAAQLTELNTIYGEIKIKHIDKAAEQDDVKKTVKINSGTKVRYTPATLQKITDKVASIRKMYIQGSPK